MLDQEEEESLTVTIALESAIHDFQPSALDLPEKIPCSSMSFDTDHEDNSHRLTSNGKVLRSNFRHLRPPTKPTEVCPVVASSILIRHLTAETRRILESMLNPSVEGRLKNWEFLCASLGVSINEIADMRRRNNPTSQVLKDFKDVSVNRFLEIFCDMRRVDLLYMIRNSVSNLKEPEVHPEKNYLNDSGLLFDSSFSINSTKSTVPADPVMDKPQTSQPGCQPSTSSSLNLKRNKVLTANEIRDVLKSKYILLLHHEESKELRSFYRMLYHNLNNSCLPGFTLLDIEKCVDEQNLNTTIHEIYDKAYQILLVFSADYSSTIVHGPSTSDINQTVPTLVKLKQLVHSYTNSEYVKNGMKNFRFRIVVFEGTDRQLVPNGWPSNTIAYEFPNNFSDLCTRIFSD